ncbi:alkaline phosphatase family protein [Streptosporangiaceae bacterium NEAU-GS5]|nr:alkaline phosphatase family protein [Streptosporangiaceae bacterium NEAU-GS5]
MTFPAAPSYGKASLSDLPGSILAAMGVPGAVDTLGMEPADRVCLFLVDGLGAELLRVYPDAAPFLSGCLDRMLTAGFPSSTPVSLASLGTGATPGGHGMIGIRVAVPGEGRLLDCLRWTAPGPPVDPEVWQPAETVYQRLASAGIDPVYIGPGMFENSGLTRAVYRGTRFVPADAPDERVDRVLEELRASRAHITVYLGDVDLAGHFFGLGSPEWRAQMAVADQMARRMAEGLPPGSSLIVTADHGMVDAPYRVDLDERADLREGVALIGGDGRARHVYTVEGAARDVLDVWRAALEGRAWVVSREEAVGAGWFGPVVRDEWLGRIGDVVAVAYGDLHLVASRSEPLESTLIGVHGSLTPDEQNVPLIEVSAR